MDKDNIKSTLTEYLVPLNHKLMLDQIKHLKLDKYVKKLDSVTTARLFVFAQLMQIQSYTDISLMVKQKKKLQKTINLKSISTSQLSRKFRDLDTAFLEKVFKDLVHKLFRRLGEGKAAGKLGNVHLINASTISLCLTKYRWAEFRKTKAGVKLHLRFVYDDNGSYPDDAILTPAKPADKTQMDALVVEDPNALNVFDRGYVDYRKFDLYCAQSIRFVTRLKSNADIHVIEEKPVMLTAKTSEQDIVSGFQYGADDYVMKPFAPKELIKNLRKKSSQVPNIRKSFYPFMELDIDWAIFEKSCRVFIFSPHSFVRMIL